MHYNSDKEIVRNVILSLNHFIYVLHHKKKASKSQILYNSTSLARLCIHQLFTGILTSSTKKTLFTFYAAFEEYLGFFFSLWGISLFCRWNITRKWESLLLSSYAVKGGILLHLIIEKPTARWERPSKHANQNTQPCSAAAVGWEWKELTGRVQPQNEEGGCTEG